MQTASTMGPRNKSGGDGWKGVAFAALSLLALFAMPQTANACACGCGVFDVGTASLFPDGKGETFFAEDDYMNQTQNQSGTQKAPGSDNDDKRITSNFTNLGWQHMFSRDWGLMVEVPVTRRTVVTDTGAGISAFHHTAMGDVKITGVYSGLSQDMSTGVIFGAKLPTGDWKYKGFDRDTSIGSGSTDILLGGYHLGHLGKDAKFGYFVQAMYQAPMATQGGYRPGRELNAAAGVYAQGWTFDNGMKLTPIAQVIGSTRSRDSGPEADPPNSGYDRVMVSPGLEFDAKTFKVYGDVELPVWQRVNGNQLVAPQYFKLTVSRSF